MEERHRWQTVIEVYGSCQKSAIPLVVDRVSGAGERKKNPSVETPGLDSTNGHVLAVRLDRSRPLTRYITVLPGPTDEMIASGVADPRRQPADFYYGLPPRWPRQQYSTLITSFHSHGSTPPCPVANREGQRTYGSVLRGA